MSNDLPLHILKFVAIFGLVPYWPERAQRVKHRHNLRQHQLLQQQEYVNKRLRWQQIYTIALIVANIGLALYAIIYVPFEDELIVSSLVSVKVFVIQILCISVILMECLLKYHQYYDFLDQYGKVKDLFKTLLNQQLCATEIVVRLKFKYAVYMIVVYGSLLVSITLICLYDYTGYFWYAMTAMLIIRTRGLQLLIYIDYLGFYMELLNSKLKILLKFRKQLEEVTTASLPIIQNAEHRSMESFDFLLNLKIVYQEIYILTERFNQLFGLSVLGIFTVLYFDIMVNMYWSFLTLAEFYKRYVLSITAATISPLLMILIVLCHSAQQCENQCALLLKSLKRLLTTQKSAALSSLNGPCYNSLLQDFIMHVMQSPIRISANDFFIINVRFLMGIFANMVTYLVILLQFRKNSESAEVTTNTENSTQVI